MTARNYPHIHAALGIDLNALGCAMLKVEPFPADLAPDPELLVDGVEGRPWVAGYVGGSETAHLTLRYGFLETFDWREHAAEIVDVASLPERLRVTRYGVFTGEEYDCVVAHVEVGHALRDINMRLTALPHIDTYPEYAPHVTVAYVAAGYGPEYAAWLGVNGPTLLRTTELWLDPLGA